MLQWSKRMYLWVPKKDYQLNAAIGKSHLWKWEVFHTSKERYKDTFLGAIETEVCPTTLNKK